MSGVKLSNACRSVASVWQRVIAAVFIPPYRPERHYMRGRGPKWHARQHALRAAVEGDSAAA
jgi:hypothetical protein